MITILESNDPTYPGFNTPFMMSNIMEMHLCLQWMVTGVHGKDGLAAVAHVEAVLRLAAGYVTTLLLSIRENHVLEQRMILYHVMITIVQVCL